MTISRNTNKPQIIVIGAGVGGLTAAALLAQAGHAVTVLEAQTYPGGSASTFFYQGYRFEAGATLAGGFQPDGPHAVLARRLGLQWPVRRSDHAWTVHLPGHVLALAGDHADVLAAFPQSARFWTEQARIADLGWKLSARGISWPPTSAAELGRLIRTGLVYFPDDVRLLRYAFSTVRGWLERHGLAADAAFKRLIDAQLLISAQTTSDRANALYSATALDLARQGVYHVEGGIGNLARTLADYVESMGGRVLYKQRVTGITLENGRAAGVTTQHGRRGTDFFACDAVVANLTPWSLDALLGDDSPPRLQREVRKRAPGWGAFVLHVGVRESALPADVPEHHQIITGLKGPLGEGRSIFVSLSPTWDTSRAPQGYRAATITTHTAIDTWWNLVERDDDAYQAHKRLYTDRLLAGVEQALPGFGAGAEVVLPGTPVTYQNWLHRYRGMVGGFPQTSLLTARGPRTGIANVRLVGDSIFPGQSTAGVTVGGMRVADDMLRWLPRPEHHSIYQPQPSRG